MSLPPDVSGQSAAQFFEDRILGYDSLIRRAVPGYDQITDTLVDELPVRATRILELGCGTGNLSLRLASRFPEARCTFIDASDEMVTLTAQRVRALAPDVAAAAEFVVGRFEDVTLPSGHFDLAVSAIALHHVRDKQPVYQRIHDWLAPNARLCFADQLRMSESNAQDRGWKEFLAFWRQPGRCTEAEIRELLAHSESHDHYETLADQFRLLATAGFRQIDAPWRAGFWGVLTASA